MQATQSVSWNVSTANVDHTISGQGTFIHILDHSATTPRAKQILKQIVHLT